MRKTRNAPTPIQQHASESCVVKNDAPQTNTAKQKPGELSEVRTIQKLAIDLSEADRVEFQKLSVEFDSCWRKYSELLPQFKSSRMDSGRILTAIQDLLAKPGKNGRFSSFLKAKRISKSKAYEIIGDYKLAQSLPTLLIEKAEEKGLDLSEKRYANRLSALVGESDITEQQADELLATLVRRPKPASKYAKDLNEDDRGVHCIFVALEKATANVPKNKKKAYLKEAFSYWMHYCAQETKPFELNVRPKPAENDWVLYPAKGKKGVAA